MTLVITGVHGVGQQQLGRRQLLRDWAPALEDGLERACGRPVPPAPFDLAFYGDVFLAGMPRTGTKGSTEDEVFANLDDEELNELVSAGREAAGEEAWQAAEAQEPKGFTRALGGSHLLLRALNWRFGPGAGLLFLGEFRQLRRYLRDPDLKQRVDAVVQAAVGERCRVLIGHSLGSVVAFEFVRQHPERQLDLLVTLGSPLGARFVRALMADPGHGADGLPPGVRAWVDVRDIRDPVACAGPLSRHWKGIEDAVVDNGGDAHAAPRYLGKRATGAAILRILPELVP